MALDNEIYLERHKCSFEVSSRLSGELSDFGSLPGEKTLRPQDHHLQEATQSRTNEERTLRTDLVKE